MDKKPNTMTLSSIRPKPVQGKSILDAYPKPKDVDLEDEDDDFIEESKEGVK